VVTTNLDAQRTAVWDMGAIASSGAPGALDLFRDVLVASASVPGVYSPVLINVKAKAGASRRCMSTAACAPTFWSCRNRCCSPAFRRPLPACIRASTS
jgi:hypothetical protein